MQNEKTSVDTVAAKTFEGGAGQYDRHPIPGDDGTIRRFVPAVARMMSEEEATR